jgi:hypothetical protein
MPEAVTIRKIGNSDLPILTKSAPIDRLATVLSAISENEREQTIRAALAKLADQERRARLLEKAESLSTDDLERRLA